MRASVNRDTVAQLPPSFLIFPTNVIKEKVFFPFYFREKRDDPKNKRSTEFGRKTKWETIHACQEDMFSLGTRSNKNVNFNHFMWHGLPNLSTRAASSPSSVPVLLPRCIYTEMLPSYCPGLSGSIMNKGCPYGKYSLSVDSLLQ